MPGPSDVVALTTAPCDRILDCARRLFAERGFEGVTMRAIAERVGLHNSSLFHHFASKSEISTRVFDGILARLLPKVEALAEDDPPSLDVLVGRVLDVAGHFLDEPDDARLLLRAIVDPEVFLAGYMEALDTNDADHPLVRIFTLVWGWLDRARRTSEIRPVSVYQATRNLFGLLLFEPAYGFGDAERIDPETRRRNRLQELECFVRGALEPTLRPTPEGSAT